MDSPAFGAAEAFVEGTIAAALVALWLLAVALHLARPYMLALTRKFTLRLGADLWWTIYVGMRDIFLLQVFLAASSSCTRMSSRPTTCPSRADWLPPAPSPPCCSSS